MSYSTLKMNVETEIGKWVTKGDDGDEPVIKKAKISLETPPGVALWTSEDVEEYVQEYAMQAVNSFVSTSYADKICDLCGGRGHIRRFCANNMTNS
jgi:hypothetical protein